MIKLAFGILIGASMAAVAQGITTGPYRGPPPSIPEGALALPTFGTDGLGRVQVIRIDERGRVYCSPEQMP
jgi:hypothetical protein